MKSLLRKGSFYATQCQYQSSLFQPDPYTYLEDTDLLKSDFLEYFEILKDGNSHEDPMLTSRGKDYLYDVIDYNVPFGKFVRAFLCIQTFLRYRQNEVESELLPEELEQIFALGWCIEWLQTFLLVADDIMDRSEMRRGKPCWYRVPHIEEKAVNDAFLLESHVYSMINKYYAKEDRAREKLKDLFHEISYVTLVGQMEDLHYNLREGDEIDLGQYTEEFYDFIVRHKTAHYTVYLPIAAAMIAAGVDNAEGLERMKDISMKVGAYFQIQDDYLDAFGDYEVMGKVGRDIEEGKCTWLVTQALDRIDENDEASLDIIREGLGSLDEGKVDKVKELYRNLKLEEVYSDFEDNIVTEISKDVEMIVDDYPEIAETYLSLLARLNKRKK